MRCFTSFSMTFRSPSVNSYGMKLGVISDTHGDLAGWRQALEGPFRGADLILHAGDVLYHGPKNPLVQGYDPPRLAEAINACPIPVIIARGNCDSPVDQLVLEPPIQAPYALVQFEGLRVLANHGDELSREEMAEQAHRYRAAVLVFGHTHIPELEKAGQVILLNPGSPSIPKPSPGGKAQPTVAVIEAGMVRILGLKEGVVLKEMGLGKARE